MVLTKMQGFTLVELLSTLSVIAIIVTIGVPSFQSIMQNNRMTTDLNLLVTDLNLSRMEAIKRGDDVTICKRNNQGTDCEKSGDWNKGWIVFSDPNRNASVETGEEIIHVKSELDSGIALISSKNRITFTSQGFSYGFATTFVMSDSRGETYARKRIISNTGRIRTG